MSNATVNILDVLEYEIRQTLDQARKRLAGIIHDLQEQERALGRGGVTEVLTAQVGELSRLAALVAGLEAREYALRTIRRLKGTDDE